MLDYCDDLLTQIVPRLADVPDVLGVALGGSRARGTATLASDYDIGLYYGQHQPLDVERLLEVVRGLVDDPTSAIVTPIGGWGPRIVGGGWLQVSGQKVDLLYRCVESVRDVIVDCRAGLVTMDYQPGHPHGFCSAIWMGEIALCRPLYDPSGIITELKALTSPYPDELRGALVATFLWEVGFTIENATTALPRGDRNHIIGCAYRALCCVSQVLFAINGRYLINEKGALAEASVLPQTIPDLLSRTEAVWAAIGRDDYAAALSELRTVAGQLEEMARYITRCLPKSTGRIV